MELNPSYAVAHQWYSLQLWYLRRPQQAYDQIRLAALLDPLADNRPTRDGAS